RMLVAREELWPYVRACRRNLSAVLDVLSYPLLLISLCVSEGDSVLEEDLWARLVDSLSRTLPTPVLDNWIRPCRLVAVEGDHLRIGAPNKLSRDWLAQNYLDALHQAARDAVGR